MWTHWNPVRIVFGEGSIKTLADQLKGRRYLLVTYPDDFAASLSRRLGQEAGHPVLTIDDVAPNPDFSLLEKQSARIANLAHPVEVIVALGGGSVIDSAKVFAAANGDFERVDEHLRRTPDASQFHPLPIIAVPTTAGTGSEVTSWGTVWDVASGKKYSLALPGLYPEIAIVDPELMVSKPLGLTISTGLDALSHAVESIWNHNANPVSMTFAVAAAREIIEVLPLLAADLANTVFRSRMALASLSAGLAFSATKTAIAHSMSYPITLRHEVIHGIACSFTLPAIARSLEGIDGAAGEGIEAILGVRPGREAAARFERFLHELGVSTQPASYGIDHAEMRSLVSEAFEGERGKNFIGRPEPLLEAFGVTA